MKELFYLSRKQQQLAHPYKRHFLRSHGVQALMTGALSATSSTAPMERSPI